MILSLMNVYSLTKEEVDKINMLKEKYPDIQEIYDIITGECQEVINKLEKIYTEHKLDEEEFKRERNFMLRLSYLYFGFKTMTIAVTKAGGNLKRLSDMHNQVISEKESILDEHSEKMKELNDQLEELKINVGKESQEKLELMQLKTKMNVIKETEKIITTPINYKKMKNQSTLDFIDNVDFCLADLDIDENGFIQISGSTIINQKTKLGLNGLDAPRVSSKDKIGYKKIAK